MAGVTVGTKDLSLLLTKLASTLDVRPIHRAWGVQLVAFTRRAFDTATAPDGQPWAPLKRPRPQTKAQKKRAKAGKTTGTGDKPLRNTGLLMASYSARGSDHVEESQGNVFVFGSSVKYAGFHNFGTGTIPARPQVQMTAAIEQRLADIAEQLIAKQLGMP